MQATFGLAREKNNSLFYSEYKNDKCSCHFHSQIELYFIDDGEMEIIVNDNRTLLKAGEMSVALSYDAHTYKTPQSSCSSVFEIPTYMCPSFMEEVKDKQVANPFIKNKETVKYIKQCIKQLNGENVNSISLSGYINLILGTIIDNISFQKCHKSVDTSLASQMLFYINENFKNDISLRSIAIHFGYAESYVSKFFKETFNIGFNKYLNILRLKNTLLLMKQNKHNVTYCAIESGFNSMRTFYRVFYNEFGCTPKKYMEGNI